MAVSKWGEQKKKHFKSETKCCQLRWKTSEVGRTFPESAWKLLCIHKTKKEKWTKNCIDPFPKKGDLGITKNYRGILSLILLLRLLMLHIWIVFNLQPRKLFGKIRLPFGEINRQVQRGKTIFWRFLKDIWFHSRRKDKVNITSVWSPQRKCYTDNNALLNITKHMVSPKKITKRMVSPKKMLHW